MATTRPEFHTNLITRLINDIFNQRSQYYYFLGRSETWGNGDSAPEVDFEQTAEIDNTIRDGIVYMRKVVPADISLVCDSYSWYSYVVPEGQPGAGTRIFDHWDHTAEMQGKAFYCITDEVGDEFNVYKCLNNAGGSISTVKPTGNAEEPFYTADGYLWKYMYNVPVFKRTKFLSKGKMPVQQALSDTFYTRGAVETVIIDNPGTGYADIANTVITVVGDGVDAVLIPSINAITGSIERVYIADGGSGYTTAPTLSVSGTGTGKYSGNLTAILNCAVVGGVIDSVWVEDPGVDYAINTAVTIVATGDGADASYTPVVYNGQIVDVIVNDPGIGYSYINLSVVAGAGGGAILTGVITSSDFISDQSTIEQVAVPGAIYNIKITDNGELYSGSTTVTITGDGTGATATPVIVDGAITGITLTSFGSGYTYANVIISDPSRPLGAADAVAYCILPPIGGHGTNAIKELYADTVAIYSLIRDDVALTALEQDYRQYGLIENPRDSVAFTKLTESSYTTTSEVVFADVTGLVPDDIIINTSTNHRYRIVDIDSTTVYLIDIGNIDQQPAQFDVFYKLVDGVPDEVTSYNITSVTSVSTVDKYSGNLMYVANRAAFIPSASQSIAVRTYITL